MIKACVTGGIANMIWGIELGVVPVEDSRDEVAPALSRERDAASYMK